MGDTFSDLPDALVRDLLTVAVPVAEEVRKRLTDLRNRRGNLRTSARAAGLIKRKADLDVPREPSVVGIDGSYQIHRLTSLDLCASAAIAVEGTYREARHLWPEPYHRMWARGIPHRDNTTGVLRGLMVSMELELARVAPHDLVLLDGSFASLIIYLNQALTSLDDASPNALDKEFHRRWLSENILQGVIELLASERVVAVPKFTSRNELTRNGQLSAPEIDGRTLATLLLEPGEYTKPIEVHIQPSGEPEEYHLPRGKYGIDDVKEAELNKSLQRVCAVYYRPFGWVPALRLELPGAVAQSSTRLSIVLEGLNRQIFSPAVVEPYPLFLADRMVKSLGSGVAVVEQTVAQHVADEGTDLELSMLFLRNYRTEGGRGGV